MIELNLKELALNRGAAERHAETFERLMVAFDRHERAFERHERAFEQHERAVEQHERAVEQHERAVERHDKAFEEHDRIFARITQTLDEHDRRAAAAQERQEAREDDLKTFIREMNVKAEKTFAEVRRWTDESIAVERKRTDEIVAELRDGRAERKAQTEALLTLIDRLPPPAEAA